MLGESPVGELGMTGLVIGGPTPLHPTRSRRGLARAGLARRVRVRCARGRGVRRPGDARVEGGGRDLKVEGRGGGGEGLAGGLLAARGGEAEQERHRERGVGPGLLGVAGELADELGQVLGAGVVFEEERDVGSVLRPDAEPVGARAEFAAAGVQVVGGFAFAVPLQEFTAAVLAGVPRPAARSGRPDGRDRGPVASSPRRVPKRAEAHQDPHPGRRREHTGCN